MISNTLKFLYLTVFGMLLCVGASRADGDQTAARSRYLGLRMEADSLLRVGVAAEAMNRAEAALDFARSQFGVRDSLTANAIALLGTIAWTEPDYLAATRYWSEALAIQEQVLPPFHPELAQTHANLGSAHYALGKFDQAVSSYRRSLDAYKISFGPDHHAVAIVEGNLAAVYVDLGRFGAAEPLLKDAIRIQWAALGDDHPSVAASIRELGLSYFEQGRLPEAEDQLLSALEIQRAIFLPDYPDSPELGKTLSGLANVYARSGKIADAEHCFAQSLRISERSLGMSHQDRVGTLLDYAQLCLEQNGPGRADSLLTLAQVALTARHGATRQLASCLEKRAVLRFVEGDLSAADSLFSGALNGMDSLLPADHPQQLDCRVEYAILCSARDRHVHARGLIASAFVAAREAFLSDGATLPERVALQYGQRLQRTTDDYLTVLTNCRDSISTWRTELAATVLAAKGVVTGIVATRARGGATTGDPEVDTLRDSLLVARYALARLRFDPPLMSHVYHRGKLERAALEKERLEQALANRSAAYRQAHEAEHLTIDDVAAALPMRTVAVDYFRYHHRSGPLAGQARYLAVVWRPEMQPITIELGPAAPIERAIEWYRSHFAHFASEDPSDYLAISADLHALIWQPLAGYLVDAETVFISPDAALNHVSFAGLQEPDGAYLIEKFAVHYLSTARDLVQYDRDVPRASAGEFPDLLSIGDPDFGHGAEPDRVSDSLADSNGPANLNHRERTGSPILKNRTWERLPGSANEVTAVVSAWRRHGGTAVQFTRSAATEGCFKTNAHRYAVVHVATHGWVDRTGSGGTYSGSLVDRRQAVENPLLLCGLALAGPRVPKAAAMDQSAEDGLLTAEEIVGLDLSGTDLVVLSACETATGDVRTGEGVFGLSRAFQLAGARCVVGALWRVEDEASSVFVPALLAQGVPLNPDRLRSAMLTLMREAGDSTAKRHPYYWAGFVATGAWK